MSSPCLFQTTHSVPPTLQRGGRHVVVRRCCGSAGGCGTGALRLRRSMLRLCLPCTIFSDTKLCKALLRSYSGICVANGHGLPKRGFSRCKLRTLRDRNTLERNPDQGYPSWSAVRQLFTLSAYFAIASCSRRSASLRSFVRRSIRFWDSETCFVLLLFEGLLRILRHLKTPLAPETSNSISTRFSRICRSFNLFNLFFFNQIFHDLPQACRMSSGSRMVASTSSSLRILTSPPSILKREPA